MHKTSRLIEIVIGVVSTETEIAKDLILSANRNIEVVEARHMVINLLHNIGVYTTHISQAFGITPRCVQYAITTFDDKLTNRHTRSNYERIRKQLCNILETTV
jgi:chromosomal replication initiation ATPase DnaA